MLNKRRRRVGLKMPLTVVRSQLPYPTAEAEAASGASAIRGIFALIFRKGRTAVSGFCASVATAAKRKPQALQQHQQQTRHRDKNERMRTDNSQPRF